MDEVTLAELGRSIKRIEDMLKDQADKNAVELSSQRHRINNIDVSLAGQRELNRSLDLRITEAHKRIDNAEDEQEATRRQMLFFLLGLLANVALLVVSFVMAAQNSPG